MTFPIRYRNKSEMALANYNYTDIATGLGFVTYYGTLDSLNGVTDTYHLVTSTATYPHVGSSSTTGTLALNFDTSTFNLQREVKGTASVNMTIRNDHGTTTACRFRAQLFKVHTNGTTTTALSSQITSYYDGTGGSSAMAATTNESFLAYLDLTQTLIKKGEKIRLIITLEDDNTETIRVYHDPTGLTSVDANQSSQLRLQIPYKIDL